MPLYTPFFERGMATIEQGRERGRTREAARSAYMGGEQEMANLYAQDPALAEQMQRTQIQKDAYGAQRQDRADAQDARTQAARLAREREDRQIQADANSFYQGLSEEVADIEDFDTAKE